MLEASIICRMSWMKRKTNIWVLEKSSQNGHWHRGWHKQLYFGHVVREERGMENDVMLGEMSGKRRRGRPRTRWLDNVNTIKGPSINSMRWDARDGAKWRSAIYRGCRQGLARLDGTI